MKSEKQLPPEVPSVPGARHALTCSKGAGKRTITHDNIQDVFIVLLKNAGFDDVVEEDVWWDLSLIHI